MTHDPPPSETTPDGGQPSSPETPSPHRAGSPGQGDGAERLRAFAPILVFDVLGPLVVYYGARSAGLSTLGSLFLSGTLPAIRVVVMVIRQRRIDAIGVMVLFGIVLGTVVGVVSGSARLYLLDGIVPTVVLGLACLVSLSFGRPLMFRFALEMMGEDTPQGRAFAGMWQHAEFRRLFRIITVVWGLVFLAESGIQALVIETSTINVAKLTSNVLPIAALVLTFGWTRRYGRRVQRRGP